MSRYTINIGQDFPLHDDSPGAAGRRFSFGLRALFVLALCAIVLGHPFHAALAIGLVLILRRNRFFAEARLRWRDHAARYGGQGGGQAWGRWNQGCGWQSGRDRRDDRREDRTKAFV